MSVQHNTEAPIHEPMLIGGKQVDSPVRIEVRNPARPDELVGTIVRGTPEDNSIYGLSASIWSRDVDQAVGVARQLEAGQVWINSHGPGAINHLAPYGGVKQSGIGRKSGIEGIREYLQSQTITTQEA